MTKVLHVVECYDAGVGRAVDRWIALSPQHEHHLLWEGLQSPKNVTGLASDRRMPSGLRARTRAVREMVDAVVPDVVIAHSSWAGVYTRATMIGVPVLYAPHAYKFEDTSQHRALRNAYRFAESILAKRTYATVVLTPREESLARSLRARARTFRVPNASTLSPTEDFPGAGYAVGGTVAMIGRLSRQKSPQYFLEVASLVREQRPETEFVWAGDGDGSARRQLEHEGVVVTGWLDGDELRRFLGRPFVYFHSAAYEGFPLSLLDAATFEHPVVVRDIPPFESLNIWRCESAAGAANALLSVLDSEAGRERARAASKWIATVMNEEAQAEALSELLGEFDETERRGLTSAAEGA